MTPTSRQSFAIVLVVATWATLSAPFVHAADLIEPTVVSSSSGVLTETLTVEEYTYTTTTPSSFSFKTRGYFGSTETSTAGQTLSALKVGPTLKFKAGDRVNVLLQNNLESNTDSVVMNTYHTPGTTNLHTHGLHISANDPYDNVMLKIEPGNSHQYQYDVIADHAAGTHWYHAHVHGSTALQAGGGLVGVLIVEDAADEIPTEYQSLDEKVMMIQYTQFDDIKTIASTAGMGESWTSLSTGITGGMAHFTTNGMYAPTIKIDQNEWTRLRMVFMALDKVVEFQLGSAAAGLGCEWKLLAKDGVYVAAAPRALSSVYMAPGNRADVLIRCTTVGTFTVDSVGGAQTHIATTTGALNFEVVASASTATTLTNFNAKIPNYLATVNAYSGVATTETHSLLFAAAGGGGGGGGGGGCNVNYDSQGAAAYTGVSLGNLAAGTVQKWSLQGSDKHPFHIHVNPYQLGTVTDATGDASSYFIAGDWHDVLFQPAGITISNVYFQTADYTGKVVAHCHFLNHEDKGCMAFWEITGTASSGISDLVASALTETTETTTTSSSVRGRAANIARALTLCVLATAFVM